jgi:hypothetical protein
MMMCTPYMSNYYLCDFFEIIDNDDVYILHVKIYDIRIYSGL